MFAASHASGSNSAGVFATSIWTGNATARSITSNIDTKNFDGLVWIKNRSVAEYNYLFDTKRGNTCAFTVGQSGQGELFNYGSKFESFDNAGFSIGADDKFNAIGQDYVGWTFRKKARFFDVVKYTGNGAGRRSISHALGVKPGLIVLEFRSVPSVAVSFSYVWHNSFNGTGRLELDTDRPINADNPIASATAAVVEVDANTQGVEYVLYVFASDDTSSSGIICGTYVGNGSSSGPTITLGWQPQFLITKCSSAYGRWVIVDSVRGFKAGSDALALGPGDIAPSSPTYLTPAESSADYFDPAPSGFSVTSTNSNVNANGETYVYMAVRA